MSIDTRAAPLDPSALEASGPMSGPAETRRTARARVTRLLAALAELFQFVPREVAQRADRRRCNTAEGRGRHGEPEVRCRVHEADGPPFPSVDARESIAS